MPASRKAAKLKKDTKAPTPKGKQSEKWAGLSRQPGIASADEFVKYTAAFAFAADARPQKCGV